MRTAAKNTLACLLVLAVGLGVAQITGIISVFNARPLDCASGDTLRFDVDLSSASPGLSEAQVFSDTIAVLNRRLSLLGPSNFQVRRVDRRIEVWVARSSGADPADIIRLVTARGILDFRVTVNASELGGPRGSDYQAALDSLNRDGPKYPLSLLVTHLRWFEIDPPSLAAFTSPEFVKASYTGRTFLLCYDDPLHALAHDRPLPWSASANSLQTSASGLELPFYLDPIGAKYLGELTGDNTHRQLAILLDDRVMSAPTIQSRITNSGRIAFDTSRSPAAVKKEAEYLKQIMAAGPLPARLQFVP